MELNLLPNGEESSSSSQAMETQTDTDSETLPPHRTVSPGYNSQGEAEEAILHEVALIASDKMTGDGGDNSGNHSSEEELEEINTNKKTYVEPERDCKRKWTDLSQSDTSCESDTEFEEPELRLELCGGDNTAGNDERSTSTSAGSCSCGTPSGDEDPNHNHQTSGTCQEPVQFSTSPPVDVHKPRRSLSPPPKLFGFNNPPPHMNGATSLSGQAPTTSPTTSSTSRSNSKLGNFSSSLGDLSRIDFDNIERRGACKKTISPRKKSRTSRVHHIQRPCLDFEKMQQLRARAVSWRHGGELSLFCW